MIELDGSYGEGGGQIVRLALIFSIALNRPFRVFNIRRKRKSPGLKRQHLHIIKTLLKISDSEAQGVELGSTELKFVPGKVRGKTLTVDFKTAGSIPLYLQSILPILLFLEGNLNLEVIGGTDVPMGPTIDFTRYAFLPFIKDSGAKVDIEVIRRGYYPEGGGRVRIVAASGALNKNPLHLRRGDLKEIKIFSVASRRLKNKKVAHRQLTTAEKLIKRKMPNGKIVEFFSYEDSGISTGSSITIISYFEGKSIISSDSLGAPGKPSETVAKEACYKLFEELKIECDVDRHLADHLIPLIALRGGSFRTSKVTDHLKTAVWVANQFLEERITLEGNLVKAGESLK